MSNNVRGRRHHSATVTIVSDTAFAIERVFDAPADVVYMVWTTPEYVRRWWGSDEMPMVACEIDLRVGGAWRYVVRIDDVEFGWHGHYREIDRPRRLVATEVFDGFPDAQAVNEMTLSETDGVTTMRTVVTHTSQANRDGHLDSGMEGGMQFTLDRLEDIVVGLVSR